MCGRYVLSDYSWRAYWEGLRILVPDDAPVTPRFNVAPTQTMPIVTGPETAPQEHTARWGLIPPWFRGDPATFRQTTFNARIETAAEKPTFRGAWATGRCLVPASGWYEWTGPRGAKLPWYVTLRTNAPVFFFAGLYTVRPGLVSYAILTREADPVLADLHPRMPVILRDTELSGWLACHPPANDLGAGFGEQLSAHRVGPVRGDAPSLIAPSGPEDAPDDDQPRLL